MSTQAISDYITKQIFIEKNVVTYRSLSRQFSLHVNTAKNELATYHHNAPYQSQNSSATFLISGTPRVDPRTKHNDEDVDMDQTQDSDNVNERGGVDEGDSDDVAQTTVLLVNEKDLEDAKAKYDAIHTVYVYSLAPVPLIDSALICDCTESVRKIDRSKGANWAATVGLVVLSGIKTVSPRKGKLPVAPQAPCVAGPSKSKPPPAPEPAPTKTEPVKMEMKVKQASSFVSTSDKGKEKNNGTGKLNFFAKSRDKKDVKLPEEVKKVKKEESVVNLNNKMFFSKPTEKASKASSTKVEKGKLRDDGQIKAKTAEEPLTAVEPSVTVARRKGTVILSDDESDDVPVKATSRRKSRASFKSESSVAMDSEADREVRALMDLDDDQVERVSHAPSTAVSELEDQSETDSAPVKIEQDDEDVNMTDHSAAQIRPKKRKAKTTIPVGKNGLKKRRIARTTARTDDNGYTHREDHTDWESVDDEEPQPEKQSKSKSKSITVKKETTKEDESLPSATPEEVKRKDNEATRKPEASKPGASRAKAKASGNVKTKKGLMNFFGPTSKKM